jgi:hypothetical protein
MSGMTGKLTEIREFDREMAHGKGNIATFAMRLPPLMAGKYIFISMLYPVIATTATISLKVIRKKEIEKFLKTSGNGGNNLKPLFPRGMRAKYIALSLLPPCQRIRRSSACHYLASQSITQPNAQPCQSEAESAAETLPHMVAEPAAYTALEGQKALNRAQPTRTTNMA